MSLEEEAPDAPTYAQQLEQQRNDEIRRHELLAQVDLGLQVSAFLDSKIGQRILSDAERELKEVTANLLNLDVDNEAERNEMRKLQRRAHVLLHWQDQFAEYIQAGRNAEHALEQGG